MELSGYSYHGGAKMGAEKYILCIPAKALERKNKVQKDVLIEQCMKDCCYCDPEKIPAGLVPLNIGVTIRDLDSNEVLVKDTEEVKRTFIYLTNINPTIHRGYDLIMFMSSVGVMNITQHNKGQLAEVMMKSIFDVGGVVWLEHNEEPSCVILDPMVMAVIYVHKDEFQQFLSGSEWSFKPIEEVREQSGHIKCIIDDLIDNPRPAEKGDEE